MHYQQFKNYLKTIVYSLLKWLKAARSSASKHNKKSIEFQPNLYMIFFSIVSEAKQCIHKKLSTCDIKELSEISDMNYDFMLNIFDCKTEKSYGLYFGIAALIILLAAVVGFVIYKRR